MTGKGDRWGRDSVGRSAPAFLSVSNFALPPLTCTARGRRHLRLLLFAARPANCGPFVCFEACAVRSICWMCLPAVLVLRAVCLFTLCLPCPLPFSTFLPPFKVHLPRSFASSLLCPVHCVLLAHLFHSMCARIVVLGPAVC